MLAPAAPYRTVLSQEHALPHCPKQSLPHILIFDQCYVYVYVYIIARISVSQYLIGSFLKGPVKYLHITHELVRVRVRVRVRIRVRFRFRLGLGF